MNRDLWNKPLDETAMAFLRECEPPEGYFVAFSGGKDSITVLDLVRRAGVKHDTHYSNTTCDPPELVQFIRREYPQVEFRRPPMSMWRIIEEKGVPTRQMRYCCAILKETAGDGRFIVTGIRHAESVARQHRGPLETSRVRRNVRFIHPIYNWSDSDVWTYIRGRGLAYCSLYDEGFKRLGCVVCPFERQVARSMARWPKLWAAARRALQRRWDGDKLDPQVRARFGTCDAWWQWWLNRDEPYPEPQRTCDGLFV